MRPDKQIETQRDQVDAKRELQGKSEPLTTHVVVHSDDCCEKAGTSKEQENESTSLLSRNDRRAQHNKFTRMGYRSESEDVILEYRISDRAKQCEDVMKRDKLQGLLSALYGKRCSVIARPIELQHAGHLLSSPFSSSPATNMLLLGLTGSIATGKSTVSNILRSPPYNLTIIDADVIARQVVEPGTDGYSKILAHFGPTTPDLLLPASEDGGQNGPNGKGRPLNRQAIGRKIFGTDPERQKDRAVLNGIVHPAVRKEIYRAIATCYLKGHWAVVLDIPLLFESGWERLCGTVMVVAVSDPKIQMKRLTERDPHLSLEEAENRVSSQTDVREKADRALKRGGASGVVVWNDKNKEQLEQEVARVMSVVQASSPKWWSWLLLIAPPLAGAVGLYNFGRSWIIMNQWKAEKAKEKAKL